MTRRTRYPLSMTSLGALRGDESGVAGVDDFYFGYGSDGAPITDTGVQPGAKSVWDIVSSLPTVARDIFVAAQEGNVASKVADINLERAKRGQAPIDASRISPQLNVGVAPNTVQAAGVGVGVIALAAVAGAWLLSRRRGR